MFCDTLFNVNVRMNDARPPPRISANGKSLYVCFVLCDLVLSITFARAFGIAVYMVSCLKVLNFEIVPT